MHRRNPRYIYIVKTGSLIALSFYVWVIKELISVVIDYSFFLISVASYFAKYTGQLSTRVSRMSKWAYWFHRKL